jgi:uncharacterized protein (DUF1697 family)
MAIWIGLFRGINVGGRNVLPMAQLREHLTALGLERAQTLIQSGNVVFSAKGGSRASIASAIEKRIADHHGFAPRVLLLRPRELRAALERNPFATDVGDPRNLQMFFLVGRAGKSNDAAIRAAASPTEEYKLVNSVFYLHAPDGIGRSKLATGIERWLGVPVTARNLRTVEKLLALASETGDA